MMMIWRGCRDIELFSSLSDNMCMGRPKNFSRDEVLEKAMPVFWKHGFADTSLQDLERATGVNKSGLYAEFRDKEDLFVECLRHYLRARRRGDSLPRSLLAGTTSRIFTRMVPLARGISRDVFLSTLCGSLLSFRAR